jgi:hypothetical protein
VGIHEAVRIAKCAPTNRATMDRPISVIMTASRAITRNPPFGVLAMDGGPSWNFESSAYGPRGAGSLSDIARNASSINEE